MTQLETALTPPTRSLAAQLANNDYLVDLIDDLTNDDRQTVRQKLAREHRRLGSAVAEDLARHGLAPYAWSQGLIEFYEQTDAFLYETLVWNRTEMKQQMRECAAAYVREASPQPQRVLVFGDGLGIDSLFLAEAGDAVDYYEVSHRCIRFAEWLAESLGRRLSIISSPRDVAPDSYDAVVCLDVLEHVPDPPEVVALLASFLRPGGRLIVHAPFWYIHPNVSTHLASNVRYSGNISKLYRAHGLRPIAGEWFWNPLVLEKVTHGAPRTPVSLAMRMKIAAGGLLLKYARVVRFPHIWAFHWMFRRDRQRLRKLAIELGG
jgi:2-polyprenyl-3-methyl-5-hydroxy-6-metoxy-1,4-benzoquinol methylase